MTFNRSHAIAYALLTYRAAWLKQHHPTEYAAAYDATAPLARGWRPACCNPAAGSAVVPVDRPQGTCPTN